MKNTVRRITFKVLALVALATVSAAAAQAGQNYNTPLGKGLIAPSTLAHTLAAPGGPEVSEEDAQIFDRGLAGVRAMYYAEAAAEDPEFAPYAVLELVYLADQFEGQPEEKELQKILKMVVRGTGTGQERWNGIENVLRSHSNRLKGTQKWYFATGVSLNKVSLFSYLEDATRLQAELRNLKQIVDSTPEGIPSSVLTPMREIAQFAAQPAYGAEDYMTIGEVTEEAMVIVLG